MVCSIWWAASGAARAEFRILFGQPDGGLSSPLELVDLSTTSFFPSSVAVGDIDGDGIPDVAAIGNFLMVFIKDGGGGFTATVYPSTAGYWGSEFFLQIGDLNGDGIGDLVFAAADLDSGTLVFEAELNQGSGVFADPVRVPLISGAVLGSAVFSFLVADLNRDGLADIVGNNPDDTQLIVLTNLGDAYFAVAQYPISAQGGNRSPPKSKRRARPDREYNCRRRRGDLRAQEFGFRSVDA